jgi:hypothetical protein
MFFSGFSLLSGNIIEWHEDTWVHFFCIVQDGSCDFLYVDKLFFSERRCFILFCVLSVGAIDRHDISGRCVLWMLWSIMLELAEDIG